MGRGRSEYWNKALGVKNALWKKLGTSEDMATSLCLDRKVQKCCVH